MARADDVPPAPDPKPVTGVDDKIRTQIADPPRPRRSPESSPVPAERPVTAVPPTAPQPEEPASAEDADRPEAEPAADPQPTQAAREPVGTDAPRREPENVPVERPTPEADAPSSSQDGTEIESAPLAPLSEDDAPPADAEAGEPATAANDRTGADAPDATTPAPAAAIPDDGPLGEPAPERPGPTVPLDRPDYDPPPRPPLDDSKLTARAPYGPPEENPLIAERQCVFPERLSVAFTAKGHFEEENRCGIDNAVEITSVGSDPAIVFANPPLVSCAFANAFAAFLVDDVQPAAETHLKSPVVEIGPGTAYACRGRNNDPDAQLSEHAFGNAFDLQALRLADDQFLTVVGIGRSTGEEKSFWRKVRQAACERFSTVLGPGADAAHSDHIHVDMAERSNDYAICEWSEFILRR